MLQSYISRLFLKSENFIKRLIYVNTRYKNLHKLFVLQYFFFWQLLSVLLQTLHTTHEPVCYGSVCNQFIRIYKLQVLYLELTQVYRCLTSFSAIVQVYHDGQFYLWMQLEYQEKTIYLSCVHFVMCEHGIHQLSRSTTTSSRVIQ